MSQNRTLITFGYHDLESPRYRNIRMFYESAGFTVIDCHTKKTGLRAKWSDLRSQWNQVQSKADALLVTFPGHYLMPLAWRLTRRPRKHLIFDAFISLSDSLVSDRRKYSWFNPVAWFLYCMDVLSCHLADEVLVDTKAHAAFFTRRFLLPPNRVKVVYLGSRTDLFFPRLKEQKGTHVLFYGSYIPLQGIEYILDAAAILQTSHPEVQFTLIGSGQTYPAIKKKANILQLRNCAFRGTVPLTDLPDLIRSSDLCLGIFGNTPKAARVIPHKVYDAVACGVPVVTRDSPAIREQFSDNKDVILCKAADARDLASSILKALGIHNG